MNDWDDQIDVRIRRQWLRLMGMWDTYAMNYGDKENYYDIKKLFYENKGIGYHFVMTSAVSAIRDRRK